MKLSRDREGSKPVAMCDRAALLCFANLASTEIQRIKKSAFAWVKNVCGLLFPHEMTDMMPLYEEHVAASHIVLWTVCYCAHAQLCKRRATVHAN